MIAAPTPGLWLNISVGQGLAVTAVPSTAYVLTVTYSLVAGPRPGAHSVSQGLGCAYPRPVRPHTRATSAPRHQRAGGSGRLLDRSRRAPRRVADLDTCARSRVLASRRAATCSGGCPEPPRFLTRAFRTSWSIQFCRAFLVSFPANRLFLSARLSTRCTSLAPSTFSPALASPAAPLPHTLSDAAGFRLSLLLSSSLSRLLPSAGPWPSSSPFFLVRRACPGLGPARSDAGRSPHGAPARPAGEDVTGPPGVSPGPPAQEPSCRERFAYRCVRGMRLRA